MRLASLVIGWLLVETALLSTQPTYTLMKSEYGCYLAGSLAMKRGSYAECRYMTDGVPHARRG